VRRQANSIMEMMRSSSTRVHLVTVLEEMPVQETLDGIAELKDTRLPVGHVIVNLVRPALIGAETAEALRSGRLGRKQVAAALSKVAADPAAAEDLIATGQAHLERQALQESQREVLATSGQPTVELPLLGDAIDQGGLFELAEILRESIMEVDT
jgi:hypothetical protein